MKVKSAGGPVVFEVSDRLTGSDKADPAKKGAFVKTHEFKMQEGATYTIDLESDEFDAFLRLEDAEGEKLKEDDDKQPGFLNACIIFAPTEGGVLHGSIGHVLRPRRPGPLSSDHPQGGRGQEVTEQMQITKTRKSESTKKARQGEDRTGSVGDFRILFLFRAFVVSCFRDSLRPRRPPMAKIRSLPIVVAVLAAPPGPALRAWQRPGVDPDTLKSSSKVLQAFHDVVARPSESTVRVRSGGKDVALGVVVDASGFILTKDSDLTTDIKVRFKDGKELDATVVGKQDQYDVALLKVDAHDLTPITWRSAKEAVVGQWVASVGPSGDPVAVGIVSVGARKLQAGRPAAARNLGTNSGYARRRPRGGRRGRRPRSSTVQEAEPRGQGRDQDRRPRSTRSTATTWKVIDQESLINAGAAAQAERRDRAQDQTRRRGPLA